MLRSMTGFGEARVETESLKASATIRSLNHRFLDLLVHTPRRMQGLEPELKRLVQAHVSRGRVEVSLQATLSDAPAEVVVASPAVVEALVAALRRIQAEHGLVGDLRAAEVARFPGIVELSEVASDLDDARREAMLGVVQRALQELDQMRRSEGAHLEANLQAALLAIESVTRRIAGLTEGEKAARKDALLARLREVREEAGLDEGRLHQEAVRFAERQDVTEELQRLESHLAQARQAVATGGPCGKRLDFLAQEMAREVNTIGSKAASRAIGEQVVSLKAEVERLREQVQNVE